MSQSMRGPPSLANYLENMGKPPATEAPPNNAVHQAAQREIQKFKGMQEKRQQLMNELQALDMQLNRTQGALEVFQSMGIIKAGM
jgi:hypothetical protein